MAQLHTLTSPHLLLPDRTHGPGKAVALLTYLCITPGRTAHRKDIFRLLYGDDTPRDADAFRQLLASLRKTLPGIFVTNGDSVSLTEDLDSDRRQFLDALHRGDDATAVALYAREFFEEFSENGCEGFLRWAHEERLRLRRRFEIAAESLVRRYLTRADWTAALAVASDVAERFPALVVSSRLLIETLTLSGRGPDIRSILAELSVARPTGTASQTRGLERLLDDVDALARDGGLSRPSRPLIGRATELRALLDAWSSARATSGGAFLIDGPDGVGKTRLLANAALRLRLDSPSVIVCRATRSDPLAGSTLLHDIAKALITLPGALGASPPSYVALKLLATSLPNREAPIDDIEGSHITESLIDCLRAVGEESPVALLIDDLDHADDAVQRTIRNIVARLRNARVLLVLATRDAFTARIDVTGRQHITLAALTRDEVRLMLSAAGAATDEATLGKVEAHTHGVPGQIVAHLEATPTNVISDRPHRAHIDAPAASFGTVLQPRVGLVRSVRWRPVSLFAGAAAIAFVAAVTLTRAEARSVSETLTVQSWSNDSIWTRSVAIGDDSDLSTTPDLELRDSVAHWPLDRMPTRISVSPDGSTLAVQLETDSSNTMDVIGVRGDMRFDLATGPRDDAMPAWSPDGSLLAFSTNRWSDAGNEGCDIAVRDVNSRSIWRVTDGPDCDIEPAWTPRGNALAFVRQSRERGDIASICQLRTLLSPPECTVIDTALVFGSMIGWSAHDAILFTAHRAGRTGIYSIDLRTGAILSVLDGLSIVEASVSPSGTLLACWCSETSQRAEQITLLRLGTRRRPFRFPGSVRTPFRHLAWYSPRTSTSASRDSLRESFLRRDQELARNGSQIADSAHNSAGGQAAARTMPTTRLPPRRLNIDSAFAVTTHTRSQSVVFDERWAAIDSSRWITFGDPRPRAISGADGLDPAGDGSYPSGLYSRQSFEADSGIIVEAIVRIPVTKPVWQEVGIGVESDEFVQSIRQWGHTSGTWDTPNSNLLYSAGLKYPGREGVGRASQLAISAANAASAHVVSPAVGDGRDVLLTLALLPDSTFTVSVNGVSLAKRRYLPPPSREYHLFIMGHSVGTDVRVRAARVWAIHRPA